MDDKMGDEDQHSQWLHFDKSSTPGDIFGEPVKKTNVGGEYQAQIPPLMTENERLQLIVLPSSHDGKSDVQDQHMFSHSIPVVWIQNQPEKKEEIMHNQWNPKGEFGVLGFGFLPLPGSSSESLSLNEHHSFLLALYIFGKNFHAVNNFMGNKGMQNVLFHYYGKFYRTNEHQKWLRYKKMKRNRCTIPGKNIFRDWRQEELFSRLFPKLTDECRTSLTQASKMFKDGKLSFETYVFNIGDMVGSGHLIEAIGIGKGNRDLTSRAKKPVKNKIIDPEFSSLTTEEIINLLKHVNGLSKARVSDLFWEAVWPLLLTRGWHAEETTNYAFQSSKNSLVFLAPGILKFSRRGLHKGNQYFESIRDVLDKVASEPKLLESDPNQEAPENPHKKQDHMQLVIVDSGIARMEDGVVKMNELRSMSDTDIPARSGDSGDPSKDSNNPATTLDSDAGKPLVPTEPYLLNETVTDQPELVDADEDGLNGQREGTRNRLLTAKALEALASGPMNPNKKKRDAEDMASRHVRARTALVKSSDLDYTGKRVDGIILEN